VVRFFDWLTRWQRNETGFYPYLLRLVPPGCTRALDAGCGAGEFARLLAGRVKNVDAVDRSAEMISVARRISSAPNVEYIEGDVAEISLEPRSYEFVSCITAIHHMDFAAAIGAFRSALAPGGVLVIFGIYKEATLGDYALSVVVNVPLNTARRVVMAAARRLAGDPRAPGAPALPPTMTLRDLQEHADRLLPGARLRRHMLWRYSLVHRS
jgi:SAM-dependent methyltransferase